MKQSTALVHWLDGLTFVALRCCDAPFLTFTSGVTRIMHYIQAIFWMLFYTKGLLRYLGGECMDRRGRIFRRKGLHEKQTWVFSRQCCSAHFKFLQLRWFLNPKLVVQERDALVVHCTNVMNRPVPLRLQKEARTMFWKEKPLQSWVAKDAVSTSCWLGIVYHRFWQSSKICFDPDKGSTKWLWLWINQYIFIYRMC